MKNRTKNILISLGFILILTTVFILNILKEDTQISLAERRKLAQFPKISAKGIISGEVTRNLEKYFIDQFIKRDFFVGLKYMFNTNIYNQQDNNKMYIYDNAIYKMEYPINEYLIEKNVKKLEEINKKYLQGMDKYYSIIPDKNYYCLSNHLKLDYNKVEEIFEKNLTDVKYINIIPKLDINDYYRTDNHWKQHRIRKIVNEFENEMDLVDTSMIEYKENRIEGFYGGLYGQTGVKIKPDDIIYLTNNTIDNCTTYNYETQKKGKIYDLGKNVDNGDKYDIFLSGATPIIEIENPKNNNKKELLIFRDSFASGLAPLFVENYKKITLIDIRYISSNLIEKYVEFRNQDVLFLYSGLVLNNVQFK